MRRDVGRKEGRQWWMWQARVWLRQGSGGVAAAQQPLPATPPQVRCRLVSSGDHSPARYLPFLPAPPIFPGFWRAGNTSPITVLSRPTVCAWRRKSDVNVAFVLIKYPSYSC